MSLASLQPAGPAGQAPGSCIRRASLLGPHPAARASRGHREPLLCHAPQRSSDQPPCGHRGRPVLLSPPHACPVPAVRPFRKPLRRRGSVTTSSAPHTVSADCCVSYLPPQGWGSSHLARPPSPGPPPALDTGAGRGARPRAHRGVRSSLAVSLEGSGFTPASTYGSTKPALTLFGSFYFQSALKKAPRSCQAWAVPDEEPVGP